MRSSQLVYILAAAISLVQFLRDPGGSGAALWLLAAVAFFQLAVTLFVLERVPRASWMRGRVPPSWQYILIPGICILALVGAFVLRSIDASLLLMLAYTAFAAVSLWGLVLAVLGLLEIRNSGLTAK